MRDMNGFQKKKNQYSLRKWLIWSLEQEMEKDTLRITCAEKEERYQRLLGPCKKYAGDKYKLSIKKNIAFNVLKQIHYKCIYKQITNKYKLLLILEKEKNSLVVRALSHNSDN